jgi:DNA repair protein RadC
MRHGIPVYRIQLNQTGSVPGISRPYEETKDAAEIFRNLLGDPDREHLLAIFLNGRKNVVGVQVIAIGSYNMVFVEARDLFGCGLLLNATDVVLVHNHPCGDPTPTEVDEVRTRELEVIGLLMAMPVLDHIIVGSTGHSSIRATGRMLLSAADGPELSDEQFESRMRELLNLPASTAVAQKRSAGQTPERVGRCLPHNAGARRAIQSMIAIFKRSIPQWATSTVNERAKKSEQTRNHSLQRKHGSR